MNPIVSAPQDHGTQKSPAQLDPIHDELHRGEVLARKPGGTVWACRDVWGHRLVARSLRPQSRRLDAVRGEWLERVGTLQTLGAPCLVGVRGAWLEGDELLVVEQRCDFRFSDFLGAPGCAPSVWLAPVARVVLEGLERAHRAGLLHLNVHPGHVVSSVAFEGLDPLALPPGSLRLADLAVGALLLRSR